MQVRIAELAKAYVRRETRYLRERSPSGALAFQRIVQRVMVLVAGFPASGSTDSIIPLTGARRIIIDGYLFDYDLIDGTVWIQNIKSSVNVNIIAIEDDSDDPV